MERKFRWDMSSDAWDVKELINKLNSGILCMDDKIEITVEPDYTFSVVYITDEDNESTDDEIMGLMDDYGFDCEIE